ncbi:hypothetical protein FRX31_022608, partial [Thalictrum thalictroides]
MALAGHSIFKYNIKNGLSGSLQYQDQYQYVINNDHFNFNIKIDLRFTMITSIPIFRGNAPT